MLFSITSVAYGLWLSLRDALCFFSKCFSKALFLKPFVPKLTMLKKKEKHHLCYLSSFLAFSCICAFFFLQTSARALGCLCQCQVHTGVVLNIGPHCCVRLCADAQLLLFAKTIQDGFYDRPLISVKALGQRLMITTLSCSS